MIPHHLPMAQQQHQSLHLQQGQQAQQGQQGDHHMGMTPFDQRAWLQQHQQMMMRNQAQNGSDMPNSQVSQQMAELMRNNNINRVQNQPNFGFPIGLNHNQPPFLDQQNQSNPQNRMSPLGFQNGMGGLGAMAGQTQASFNANLNNRNMMLQALQRDSNNNRQLELMNLAQNQQNQNGPINLANRLGAPGMPPHQPGAFNNTGQPGMSQPGGPAQGDLFPGAVEGMRRPSPHPQGQPAQQSSPPGGGPAFGTLPQQSMNPALNPGPNANGRRPITLSDLQERQNTMKAALGQLEMQMRTLFGQRSQLTEPAFALKMRGYQADMNNKKDALSRITLLISQMTSQGITQMPFPNAQMGGNPVVQGGQPQQPPWMQQTHPMPQNTPFGTPASTNPAQANGHSSPPPGHVMNGTPRPGGQTPHTPTSNAFSPGNQGGGNPVAFNGSQPPPSGLGMPTNPAALAASLQQAPQPLAKDKFTLTYKTWCAKNNVTHDQRLLSIDNLNIDLYTLHVEVLKEGGIAAVQSKDLWSIIAGRMGCVQFPGTATDPPKSGPAAANQLAHVYKEYLAEFDRFYIANFRMRMMITQISANQLFRGMELTKVLQLVNTPASDLQTRGIPGDVIRMIEVTRPALHTLMADQNLLQNVLKNRAQNPVGNANTPADSGGHLGFNGVGGQIRPIGNLGPNAAPGNSGMFPPKQELMNPIAGTPNHLRIQAATNEIQLMKQEVQNRLQSNPTVAEVSDADRMEYNNLLEAAFRNASTMEQKLPFFHTIVTARQPEAGIQHTRKLIAYVVHIQHQRQMIGYSQPRFIMSMQELKAAHEFIQKSHEFVGNQAKIMSGQRPDATVARPPTQLPVNPSPMAQHPSPPNGPPQSSPPPLSRPPVNLTLPKKKGSQATPQLSAASPPNNGVVANANTPTPPANPSTPAANATTPAASSPQTPKSPKNKAHPKPSKVLTKRKNSTTITTKASTTPTATPVTEPAVIPSTNSTPTNSLKRKLEEEEPSLATATTSSTPSSSTTAPSTSQGPPAANEPSPPKKFKTEEWDGPPSEELRKKEEVVENIKSEEDASAFLEQMTQLIQMSTAEDGGSSLSQDISDTLDMILKGCSTIPDGDNGMTSLLGDLSSASTSEPTKDEFVEFFDFSSYAAHEEDDSGSKANTPDLIPSSSTNQSPESGSDTDPVHHTSLLSETKFEEYSDPLRLGTLKEIDGGESTYYHSNEWKWDTPMTTLDQPWAVFNS